MGKNAIFCLSEAAESVRSTNQEKPAKFKFLSKK